MAGQAYLVKDKTRRKEPVRREPTGIEELDSALSGGFPEGSAILVNGGPGSGKTILGMTFLVNGAEKYDEKGTYISFGESRTTMEENMKSLGMGIEKLEEGGKLYFQEMFAATGKAMGDLLTQAVDVISKNGVKRVVVDSLSAISQAMDDEYEARQVFHTVIQKLIRGLGCTTIVISERSARTEEHAPYEEFVADGIITLRADVPRQLEVRKMRGTKLGKRNFVFTIDHGFTVLETRVCAPKEPQKWKPIPISDSTISSGVPDLDRVLGGGFPAGTYVVLEADTNVSLGELRLFLHSLAMNFLSQKLGVLYLPVGGADSREIVCHIEPYLSQDSLGLLRVAEELKAEELRTAEAQIPPYVVLMKGGRNNIDVDTYMLFDTLTNLKRQTDNKPVLRLMGYDTMESKYAEVPEKLYNEIGFAIMRTRAAGDLTIGIARPKLTILPKILDMVDWHLKLWRAEGTLIFQGTKPLTPKYAVVCDTSKGYPQPKLVEMT